MSRKAKESITYIHADWLTSHSRAKSLAKKWRSKGYFSFIEKNGSGWHILRSDKKRKDIS